MLIRRGNLFDAPQESADEELFEQLLAGSNFRLERIVSTGQATPSGEWYDQDADEFVTLLAGAATLRFADPDLTLDLTPGDWLVIPAHRRHRVEFTAAATHSVWLAIHFER